MSDWNENTLNIPAIKIMHLKHFNTVDQNKICHRISANQSHLASNYVCCQCYDCVLQLKSKLSVSVSLHKVNEP